MYSQLTISLVVVIAVHFLSRGSPTFQVPSSILQVSMVKYSFSGSHLCTCSWFFVLELRLAVGLRRSEWVHHPLQSCSQSGVMTHCISPKSQLLTPPSRLWHSRKPSTCRTHSKSKLEDRLLPQSFLARWLSHFTLRHYF